MNKYSDPGRRREPDVEGAPLPKQPTDHRRLRLDQRIPGAATLTMNGRSVCRHENGFQYANRYSWWSEIVGTDGAGRENYRHCDQHATRHPTVFIAKFLAHLASNPLHTNHFLLIPVEDTSRIEFASAEMVYHFPAPRREPQSLLAFPRYSSLSWPRPWLSPSSTICPPNLLIIAEPPSGCGKKRRT